MPAFQSPCVGSKRKHSYDETNLPQSKRVIITDEAEHSSSSNSRRADAYWIVQWYASRSTSHTTLAQSLRRNPQYKKHKTWYGVAVLIIRGEWCELQETDNGQK